MARLVLILILAALSWAQQPQQQPQLPPEEDEKEAAKEYTFNPIQAKNEIKVGNFYLKKGSWRAAALRFEEATKWDPMNAEAFLRLAETREKMKSTQQAVAAYEKYLELAPEAKDAALVKKKIAQFKR